MTTGETIVSKAKQALDLETFRDQHWTGSFAQYLDLVRKDPKITRSAFERIYDMIEAEFHRTVRAVLAVTQQKELLEKNQVLARSIKLRNPYVDPMHLIQVDMLQRKRAALGRDQLV